MIFKVIFFLIMIKYSYYLKNQIYTIIFKISILQFLILYISKFEIYLKNLYSHNSLKFYLILKIFKFNI